MEDLLTRDIPSATQAREDFEEINNARIDTKEIDSILRVCISSLVYQIEEQNKNGYNWSNAIIPIDNSHLSMIKDIVKKLEGIFTEKGYRFKYKINYKYKNKREISKENFIKILKDSYENGDGYGTFKYGLERYEEPYIIGGVLELTIYW